MIKSNKRKPGTINTAPLQRPPPTEHLAEYICYDLNAQNHVLEELNRQKTGKRPPPHKNFDFFALELSNRNISNLERQLDRDLKLECIRSLDLSLNQLTTFPACIFSKLTNLTALDLHDNSLQKLSFPYFEPNLITHVNLSNNRLASLNLEHLAALTDLRCHHNHLTFLTLPAALTTLDCSSNNLSNVYSIEHCLLLQQLYFAENMLYDLNLNFGRTKSPNPAQMRFKHLELLDCCNNRIEQLEGMANIANTRILKIAGNKLAFTRNIINQLLLLTHLQQISFDDNPITEAGFTQQEIHEILATKMHALDSINGEQLPTHYSTNTLPFNEQHTHYSANTLPFNDQPYCLFMQSSPKKPPRDSSKEWIFTLGDCDPEDPKDDKINDLSQIEETHQLDQTVIDRLALKNQSKSLDYHRAEEQAARVQKLLTSEAQELKLKLVRSNSSPAPSHVHYQSFLSALLQMSYIPCQPVLSKGSKITSKRLDESHDDFVLIAKMLEPRGGVVYVKKITAWVIEQEAQDLFGRHTTNNTAQMGFLLNELTEKQFRELCKYNKLIPRSPHDILGLQPNVFSCYHVLVRHGYQKAGHEYLAAYLVESGHL